MTSLEVSSLDLVHECASTSSGINGWSSLSQFLECPAKAMAARNELLARNGAPYELFPEDGTPVATLVGSLYGSLIEAWLMGVPVRPGAKFAWNGASIEQSHPLSCAEARRLADDRILKGFDFGKVEATQVDVVIPESLFGLEITGNLDLVVRRGDEIFIGDLKTEGKREATLEDKFSLRQQLWIYCLGYELKTGVRPAGCFIDLCVKTKDPKFETFIYEGVTERRLAWLAASVERVKEAMKRPSPLPSVANCLSYKRSCKFLTDGMCMFVGRKGGG